MALVLAWQWTTVRVNYGGNWSALFETGGDARVPKSLAAEKLYRFAGSGGFDGQQYHYIAHDPFLRTPDLRASVDEPRLRYRRILLPALAWALALGQSSWIDRAYFAVCLAFIGLGVWWASRLAIKLSFAPAWGLAFLVAPAVLVTVDRMVADAALAALTVAFFYYLDRAGWKLWLVLAAAALTRETGILLAASYCVYLAANRRWRLALSYAAALAPAAAWYLYVASKTSPFDYHESFLPLASTIGAMLRPAVYPASRFASSVQAADALALAGALAAFALTAFVALTARPLPPENAAMLCFTLLGVFSQRPDQWRQVFDFGRVYTPLLLLLAIEAMRRRRWYLAAPWLMMLPRVAMQFAPQIEGVARALA